MAALPVKQARKRREQLNGFQFWLAGYVIFLFLIGLKQRLKYILARWILYFSPQNTPQCPMKLL